LREAEKTNDRIMRHVVAVRVGLEYNIFFDEAPLDLETLLNGDYHSCYADSDMTPQELLGQAWDLAGAIHFLHHELFDRCTHYSCCHRDLTPASILVVRNARYPVGKWMLAEFGITILKTEVRNGRDMIDLYGDEDQDRTFAAVANRYCSEYQPPEAETSATSHAWEDGHQGDIWCFGCILIALLAFSLGGGTSFQRLQAIKQGDGRTNVYYAPDYSGNVPTFKVKDALKSWAYELKKDSRIWILEWLNLVFDQILLILPDQRLEAQPIQTQLTKICRLAPKENVWDGLPPDPDPRRPSTSWIDPSRRRSSAAVISPSRPSFAMQASPPPSAPAQLVTRKASPVNLDKDPLMIERQPSQLSTGPPTLSPRSSDSEGTTSIGSARRAPDDEASLSEDLPDANDMAVCSSSGRLVFWCKRGVVPFRRNTSAIFPGARLFFRQTDTTLDPWLVARQPETWIDVSLASSYLGLMKSNPVQVRTSNGHARGVK
jgi:serine/threonine protein kinase